MFEKKTYSKIPQLAGVLKELRAYPHHIPDNGILNFEGTVKLHGTNAGVRFEGGEFVYCQTRNNVNITEGHFGFVEFAKNTDWQPIVDRIGLKNFILFGEWAGEGIQKGVGIAQLPKQFYVFEVWDLEACAWLNNYPSLASLAPGVFDLREFGTFQMTLEVHNPAEANNYAVQHTQEVEDSCPVTRSFGESGIGEGIVWKCIENPHFKFKTKGQKHSESNVKVAKEVDIEVLNAVMALADPMLTARRFEQGLEYLQEMGLEVSMKSMGPLLKYMVNDILIEEEIAIEAAEGVEKKAVGKYLSNKIRLWFVAEVNKGVGL